MSKKHRASCGHLVSDGILAEINDGAGTAYGTWCNECLKAWNDQGKILNEELDTLLTELKTIRQKLESIKTAEN